MLTAWHRLSYRGLGVAVSVEGTREFCVGRVRGEERRDRWADQPLMSKRATKRHEVTSALADFGEGAIATDGAFVVVRIEEGE